MLSCFALSFKRDSSRPDHIFGMRWEEFIRKTDLKLLPALRLVRQGYLSVLHGKLYLSSHEAFFRWQNLRSRMSMLPIKILAMTEEGFSPVTLLAHPHSHSMEDYIRENGLNETHLHLHAYMYPEECWLVDLYDTEHFAAKECRQFRNDKELSKHYITINPDLTPIRLVNRMKLARQLRDNIILLLQDPTLGEKCISEAYQAITSFRQTPENYSCASCRIPVPRLYTHRMEQEIQMWKHAILYINERQRFSQDLQLLLHIYLLIENEYIQLNRHAENHNGFETFETISSHLRQQVGSKEYYLSAFRKICRVAHAQEHNCIEVRIPPSTFEKKWKELLLYWNEAYTDTQGEAHPSRLSHAHRTANNAPHLTLVAHFIKHRPTAVNPDGKLCLPDLYEAERLLYCQQAERLAKVIRYNKLESSVPIGIDAAGSELVLPPEVFAPAYRIFTRQTKITYKTYHCGEDFRHLISGIRAVHEAVEFLDLRNGNRLGHATAIGIPPTRWLERMPNKLLITRREWLLDLIFAWKVFILRDSGRANLIEAEALRIAKTIFGKKFAKAFNIHDLSDLYDARKFIPRYIFRGNSGIYRSTDEKEEYKLISDFTTERGCAFIDWLQIWHRDVGVRKRMDEKTEVETTYLNAQELLILQQYMMQEIRERDIIVETLPVSNLRISQYTDIRQHHMLRWLGIAPYAEQGDVPINICIGSDDPGIFVTDIRNEYYHLYYLLRHNGLSASEAMRHVRRVNDAGRIYAFKNTPNGNKQPENDEWRKHHPFGRFPAERYL